MAKASERLKGMRTYSLEEITPMDVLGQMGTEVQDGIEVPGG